MACTAITRASDSINNPTLSADNALYLLQTAPGVMRGQLLQANKEPGNGGAHQVRERGRRQGAQPKLGDFRRALR
jgi:hypothetical protein